MRALGLGTELKSLGARRSLKRCLLPFALSVFVYEVIGLILRAVFRLAKLLPPKFAGELPPRHSFSPQPEPACTPPLRHILAGMAGNLQGRRKKSMTPRFNSDLWQLGAWSLASRHTQGRAHIGTRR